MAVKPLPVKVNPWDNEKQQIPLVWQGYYQSLGTSSFAPSNATYIVQTPSSDLTNEQALSTLTSGFMKVTTGTGVVTSTGYTTIQASDLANTAVTAGSYMVNGSSIFTVDQQGRLTAASSPTITITGTTNKIDISGGSGVTPTVTIASTYVGQSSITTLGTIGTGVWNGTAIITTYGGTGLTSYSQGDILYYNSGTTLTALTKSASATRYLSNQGTSNNPSWNQVNLTNGVTGTLPAGNGGTGVTSLGDITKVSDTNVTLTLGGTPTGAVVTSTSFTLGWTGTLAASRGGTGVGTLGDLTRVSDTNVTLTLGGTPTGALITSTSITAGWSGQLSLTRGGTAASLTADNGAVVYSTASALALLASTSTANKLLCSGSSGAPTWSTPTFPNASATSRKIIVSDGTNWVASTETYAVPSTSGKIMQSDGTNWTSATPTGSGTPVLATSPTLVTPLLGTPTSGTLSNCTGYTEANLSVSDITTNNASTSAHGFLKKLDNNAAHFMDGTGSWSSPSGSGTVNSGTAGQMAYYASSTTAVSGNANATISNGVLTLGIATSVIGTLGLSGNTSGVVSILPQAAAGTYNFNLPTTAGTSGYFLTSAGGGSSAMTWTGTIPVANGGTGVAAIQSFSATTSGTTTLSANTYTKVNFKSEQWDVGGVYDATTNSRFLPTVAGIYSVTWSVYVSDAALLTWYGSAVYKNDALYRTGWYGEITVVNTLILTGSALVSMNGSTDYIEIYAYNGAAATTYTVNATSPYSHFDAIWVGPAS